MDATCLLIGESISAVHVFFNPKFFDPDKNEIRMLINALAVSGNCMTGDLSRFLGGEITFFFNPTYHNVEDRKIVIKAIRKALGEPQIVEEDEFDSFI